LEKLGIMPHGDMKMIEDRVYFTDAAFNQNEFTKIIQLFSRDNDSLKETKFPNGLPDRQSDLSYIQDFTDKTRGMEFSIGRFAEIMPIMGMWGINGTVVNDGVTPMPYYASSQYKEFLLYIEDLAAQDTLIAGPAIYDFSVTTRGSYTKDYNVYNITGHWNDDLYFLMSNIDEVLKYVPEARILITPPEIGDGGLSGVGAAQPHPYGTDGAWVIGEWVDEEKLARILELFDGLSCDQEVYMAANYGLIRQENDIGEMETIFKYNWIGEPYASRILDKAEISYNRLAIQDFSTNVFDEKAAKLIYMTGQNALSDYAVSPAARERLLQPYKEDPLGIHADEKAFLDESYAKKLQQMAWKYFYDKAIWGWPGNDVASTWDGYLQSLRENGLQSYIDLYKKYP
jgi:hypothetical protein